jgi:DNA repair protein RadC
MRYRLTEMTVSVIRDRGDLALKRRRRLKIDGPKRAADLARDILATMDDDRERFLVIMLDASHRYVAHHIVSVGTMNCSLVHPREAFRTAIMMGSSAIVLAHNHPSGNMTASVEDRQLTSRLRSVGEIVGIKVLDHVVVDLGSDRFATA